MEAVAGQDSGGVPVTDPLIGMRKRTAPRISGEPGQAVERDIHLIPLLALDASKMAKDIGGVTDSLAVGSKPDRFYLCAL